MHDRSTAAAASLYRTLPQDLPSGVSSLQIAATYQCNARCQPGANLHVNSQANSHMRINPSVLELDGLAVDAVPAAGNARELSAERSKPVHCQCFNCASMADVHRCSHAMTCLSSVGFGKPSPCKKLQQRLLRPKQTSSSQHIRIELKSNEVSDVSAGASAGRALSMHI